MAFPKSMSCLVATNMNIFICSGTWRGGCLCWTAWPPQQDAGQDALWEVNELKSFSVGSDISLAWRDLDHLQDFISSQYNLGHCWFFLQMITSAAEADHPWSSTYNLQDQPLRDQGAWLGDDVRAQSSSQGGRKLSAYWGEAVKWKRLLKRERMVEKLF